MVQTGRFMCYAMIVSTDRRSLIAGQEDQRADHMNESLIQINLVLVKKRK